MGGGRAANPGVAALNVLAWYTRNFGQNGAEVFFSCGMAIILLRAFALQAAEPGRRHGRGTLRIALMAVLPVGVNQRRIYSNQQYFGSWWAQASESERERGGRERERDMQGKEERRKRREKKERESDRQTDRQAGRQAGRQTERQADRQTDRETGRQADSQAGRQTGRQADRQTDRQKREEREREKKK